jgi:hypothetical protein
MTDILKPTVLGDVQRLDGRRPWLPPLVISSTVAQETSAKSFGTTADFHSYTSDVYS